MIKLKKDIEHLKAGDALYVDKETRLLVNNNQGKYSILGYYENVFVVGVNDDFMKLRCAALQLKIKSDLEKLVKDGIIINE